MEEMTASESLSIESQTVTLIKSLECFLCKNPFENPCEIDCGHVFCSECLGTYISSKKNVKSIECPRCFKQCKLPPGDVQDLPKHLFYKDLSKEIGKLDIDKPVRGSCKFCNDQNKELASVKCTACQATMCEKCASNHVHNGVTNVVQLHRRQDSMLCDILPKRDTACEIHPTESLAFYCSTCNSCVCFKCKDDKHQDHLVCDLADSSHSAKTLISDVQSKLKDYLTETKEALNDIDRIGKDSTEKIEATKDQIESAFNRLVTHILREKDKLLDDIDAHAEDIQNRLKEGQKEMHGKDERARAMSDLTENLLLYGNDAESTSYKPKIEKRWKEMQEDKLNRFGQGYKMDVRFFMTDGVLDLMAKDIGRFCVIQTLSPWTSRKSKPFAFDPVTGNGLDATALHKQMRSAISNDFSLKRSQIFARFVDPKWNLETFKINKASGQTVTVWIRVDEEYEQTVRASKRLSMRSVSSPVLVAEVESFNENGEQEYRKRIEKLPDGTIVRLAIGGKDTIMLAVYPGLYASSIISQAKMKSLSKKDTDGIYVAILERGNFVCGELRKIPIPEGPGFDFDITSRGIIVVKPVLSPDLKIYSTLCNEITTDHGMQELAIRKILESPENETVVLCVDKEDNLICETITDSGGREARFTFPMGRLYYPMPCRFKDACFDRQGSLLIHIKVGANDVLYQITDKDYRVESLEKPEMLHKVDKLAVLPDGRMCVFDRTECILMNLRYLPATRM